MAQYPTYENNRLARIIPAYYYNQLEKDPTHPLLNYAIQTEFPPGSTFKVVTMLAGLRQGLVSANSHEAQGCAGGFGGTSGGDADFGDMRAGF